MTRLSDPFDSRGLDAGGRLADTVRDWKSERIGRLVIRMVGRALGAQWPDRQRPGRSADRDLLMA